MLSPTFYAALEEIQWAVLVGGPGAAIVVILAELPALQRVGPVTRATASTLALVVPGLVVGRVLAIGATILMEALS